MKGKRLGDRDTSSAKKKNECGFQFDRVRFSVFQDATRLGKMGNRFGGGGRGVERMHDRGTTRRGRRRKRNEHVRMID